MKVGDVVSVAIVEGNRAKRRTLEAKVIQVTDRIVAVQTKWFKTSFRHGEPMEMRRIGSHLV